jgi:hypothetical protein
MKRKIFLLSLLLSSFFAELPAQAVGVLVEAARVGRHNGLPPDPEVKKPSKTVN